MKTKDKPDYLFGMYGCLSRTFISKDTVTKKRWLTVYTDDGKGNGLEILSAPYDEIENFLRPEYRIGYPGNPSKNDEE